MAEQINHESCEVVSLKIETFQKPIIITSYYRTPSREIDIKGIETLASICKKYKDNPVWIGGDFNLPDIDWASNSIADHQYPKKLNEAYLELFDKGNLVQLVDFTTRENATLDILLTNRPTFLENCEQLAGFGDHDTAILTDIICHPQKIKPVQRKVFVWKRADIASLRKDITDNLAKITSMETVETPINELWENFRLILDNARDKHVPSKFTSTRYSQPWFNTDCKRAVKKKKRRYRVYKRTKLEKDREKYKSAEKEARTKCKEAYNNYIKENILDSDGD
eukprot:TCONS_00042481-protein